MADESTNQKDKSEQILSDTYLDSIASKGNPTVSTLCFIAKDRANYSTYISQVNSMWEKLPDNAKSKMKNMLRSSKDGNFRGAFGNLVAHEILIKYFKNVEYDPLIDGFTPDFKATNEAEEYIFEAFCLGKDQNEHLLNKKMILVQNEFKLFRHNSRHISLSGSPIPNAKGDFNGIGQKTLEYVSSVDLSEMEEDEIHKVEHDGAMVFFRIGETEGDLPLMIGWTHHGARGNPQVDLLDTELKERIEKYKYPFSVICILDSTVWGPVYTLLEAMLGKFVFKVPIAMNGESSKVDETTLEHDQTGFWGTKNPNFKENMNVESVLFISCGWKWDENHKLVTTLHLLENPYKKPSVTQVLRDIPNLLDPSFTGDRLKMPGLRIEL